jgi:aminoglycoside phosphotransferase (APT) family kinase protein
MSTPTRARPTFDTTDLEPSVKLLMERKERATRNAGPYVPVGASGVAAGLSSFFETREPDIVVGAVTPMGGGASKEQYVVTLARGGSPGVPYVLRLDALQSVMESDRLHEYDVLRLVAPHVSVPDAVWVDPEGEAFGRPFLMTSFVSGVPKPTDTTNDSVSGLQTHMSAELRAALSTQFIDALAAIHRVPLDASNLGSLGLPDADPHQSARWQLNWWSRVWQDDKVVSHPLIAQVEVWLQSHIPADNGLVVVHGDYRTGNYLFDEKTRQITSILDWELAHIGDYHEDLGWAVQRMYSTVVDGERLVTGLMPRDELISGYEAASGRTVSPQSLHYYEVLCAYKSTVATLASSVRAAAARHNHQDVLLSWLASCGYVFASGLCDLIERGPAS